MPLSLYGYELTYLPPVSSSFLEPRSTGVSAAYFVEEGPYTFFKDADHKVVYAVRTDYVVSIRRGGPVVGDDG